MIRILPLFLVLAACNTVEVGTDTVAGLATPVLARHDAYVLADPGLTDADRAPLLAQSVAVREALVGEKVDARAILPLLAAPMDRHDAYLRADPLIDPGDRNTYLRSTEILRLLLGEASTP